MWAWSTTEVQTIAIVIQTMVFGLQTVVLAETLSTVKKQAIAADAQAHASENQADMAIQQTYANIAQADLTMRPLITLEPTNPRHAQEEILDLRLRNDGLGPAFEVRAFLEERTIESRMFARVDLLLFEDSLGTNRETTTSFTASKLVFQNLVVEYRSSMRSLYETRFVFGENDGMYYQSTRLKEQPYATLADERFQSLFTTPAPRTRHPR
jgi:hypothetical protein